MYVDCALFSSSHSREHETHLFGACNHSKMLNGPHWVVLMVFENWSAGISSDLLRAYPSAECLRLKSDLGYS